MWGPKSLNLLYSIINLNTISLPLVGKANKMGQLMQGNQILEKSTRATVN
jgi:hypothetical protein